MRKYLVLLLIDLTGIAKAQSQCSNTWYQSVDKVLHTADMQGHGPDLGSDEWKSVIEIKLGVQDGSDVPERSSEQWCNYIDQQISAIQSTGRAREHRRLSVRHLVHLTIAQRRSLAVSKH